MFQFGAAAYAHMTSVLVTMLAVIFVTGLALVLLPALGQALRVVVSAVVRRRQERRSAAWQHAEAVRGIAQLEWYLGRRDARH
ncbi:hypothetical protein [Phytoactinopolyspora halotolerans]|uniref:Uncharacterized protein n=1 Tax=Phytoactinopolyspora halotolerans TaxID=1981512 RepID=A0A6L9SES4_9ACTN|nr:hypothetical protein [Phytoactinopolyspora halotolerans]NEE02991.1 hypothetical protein [Phytoactinopolyspora halotolerans]